MEAFLALLEQPEARGLIVALLGSAALLTALNDALASFLSKVPLVGGFLAVTVRRLTPLFWDWLRKTAITSQQVVAEVDKQLPSLNKAGDATKKREAMVLLDKREPGMTQKQRSEAIEAALDRIKGLEKIRHRTQEKLEMSK